MKRLVLLVMAAIAISHSCYSQEAADSPLDLSRTLRLNYIFSGTATEQDISLAELCSIDGWAGRRVNMDKLPLRGNGQVIMEVRSEEGGEFDKVVYKISFSTLFQEWQATEEATTTRKSFENVFLVPMPSREARLTVRLFDFHGGVSREYSHVVNPKDILIRPTGAEPSPHEWIWKGGDDLEAALDSENRIDVAILAEGYTEDEMDTFMDHAREAMASLWAHEPFGSMKDRFNIVCVKAPSRESGVSAPKRVVWKNTPVGSHFDTFYSDRYLTTLNLFKLHDLLAGIPYEHIIILANTSIYGGGGIYNSYTLTTTGHPGYRPVVVHEFGHSFAGLADEYYYDDQYSEQYYPDTEPWERNITTMKDFDSKWKGLVGKLFETDDTAIDWRGKKTVEGKTAVDLYEGGGYQSKGVWRGFPDCRMNTNSYPSFCPVCREAIRDMILFYTVETGQ
ncbi:MAG: peptidase M64 [Bacteroidales bacterium]|nr:peptidase M64 [Bacteroidales bacterium]